MCSLIQECPYCGSKLPVLANYCCYCGSPLTGGTRRVVEIPPLAYQDYPIDIHIRVYQEGARHGADIRAIGKALRVPVEMSVHDLRALSRQLQTAVETAAKEMAKDQALTADKREGQLRTLAEKGHYAFKRVFGHPDALTAIQDLLALSPKVSIEIVSENFFLPWELLYPDPVGLEDEPLSYERFWGMNCVISRVIVQSTRPGAFVSPVIHVADRPRLGLLTYLGLDHVVKREIPFFEQLHDNGKIALFHLRPLDRKKKQVELGEFKAFWGNALNLAHFACHASYDNEEPELSCILLSDQFPISLQDMEVYSIQINGNPLIIMNTCETGNVNPLYTLYFARAFLKYGALGVVATECDVPDAFAADFAEQLYGHLLAGEPLGASLLATRRYFLQEYNNPSGLLYSMYAPESIRLVRQKGRTE